MCNSQISFEAVQKSSDNSTMQIKEEWLHWFKDILIYCFAKHYEEWWNSSVHDADYKSTV